jgi:hypothetical protein
MTANPCPVCGRSIPLDDINIKEGVGLCRGCGKLSRLADIADQPAVDPEALSRPPKGCIYEPQIGGGAIVRASLRSPGAALGTLAVCLFWNGITSIFVLLALSGLYVHFIGPLPKWFPAPTSKGEDGNLGSDMPLGMTLFLCIFLIPFVAIGFMMILAFLNSLMGRVEVIISMNEGRVRTGIGPFNWTRRFDASKVKRVATSQTRYVQNGQRKQLIEIEAEDRRVRFGSMLRDERRAWMLGVLHLLLVAPAKGGKAMAGISTMMRG